RRTVPGLRAVAGGGRDRTDCSGSARAGGGDPPTEPVAAGRLGSAGRDRRRGRRDVRGDPQRPGAGRPDRAPVPGRGQRPRREPPTGGAAPATPLSAGVTRPKRRRAPQAVYELRAMAHLIDMHQVIKDPDRFGPPTQPIIVSGKPMDADAMGRYLHFCTELLAVVSKIGQLYVQDFPDATAQTAVDHFEGLATGLSSKIWQKLMILDRIRS